MASHESLDDRHLVSLGEDLRQSGLHFSGRDDFDVVAAYPSIPEFRLL